MAPRPTLRSALLAATLLASARAHAQTADASGYRALVDNGVSEFAGGNYQEALASFLRAYQVRPTARVLRGIAKVRFELRQYSACLDSIDAALAAGDDPLTSEMRAEMDALRSRTLGYVGTMTVRVSPDGAEVTLDGQPLSRALRGVPFRVDIGHHEVDVSASGYSTSRRAVDVLAGGDTQLVVVGLTASRTNPLFVTSLVVGIAAAAGAVGSSIWLVNRLDAVDRCQTAIDRGANCANADALHGERDIAMWTLIGSSALFVGSAVAFGLSLRSREQAPAALACAPIPGGGLCTGGIRW
jgi:hypothetical protein